MQLRISSKSNPPIPAARPMTRGLWSSTQDLILPPTVEPSHLPLLQWPLPSQGVPSRKFCCMLPHSFEGRTDEAHQSVHDESSQAYVSLLPRTEPRTVLHCRSRLVHCPLAQARPVSLPLLQLVPSDRCLSAGQSPVVPEQTSATSQGPAAARQVVLAAANWQPVQQASFESSHTAVLLNLQVVGSQHLLSPHPAVPPQSQSSPLSTMPLPHWLPVVVTTPLLSTRQLDWTLLRPIAEQMLPIVHCEKFSRSEDVVGFMMYLPSASHDVEVSGQH